MDAIIERDCVFVHEGQKFESGGSWLAPCPDGYWRGVVYANPEKGIVTTWHGEIISKAEFGPIYRGGFGGRRMRSVTFTYQGLRFTGRYGIDWADAVRVRSTTKQA